MWNSETVVSFCVDFNASLLISCPYRRCKLRVLDLRNTGQSFWNMWSGASTHGFSSFGTAPVAEQSSKTHQPLAPLKILYIELCLKNMTLDNFLPTSSGGWIREKLPFTFCCKKLTIFAMPVENVMKVLNMVQLTASRRCKWIDLASVHSDKFAPLLGSDEQCAETPSLPHSHVCPWEAGAAGAKLSNLPLSFSAVPSPGSLSRFSLSFLKAAWTRCSGVYHWLLAEHNIGKSNTLGSLLLYTELRYHQHRNQGKGTGTSH